MPPPPGPPKPFELGLVMAGAVSAGAYTAGVLDFLFQALDEWEKAKRAGKPGIPDHAVRISVAAGASAGGIATALLPLSAFTWPGAIDLAGLPYDAPVPAAAAAHLLFRAWVTQIDILGLLDTRDLPDAKAKLVALLDGTVLREIADGAANDGAAAIRAGAKSRFAWLANPLQLILTVSNLRGVPYLLPMQADAVRGHRMMNHADYAHFAVFGTGPGAAGKLPAGASALNANGKAELVQLLADAALATAAFPIGLPPRRFANPLALYRARRWPVPGAADGAELTPDLTAGADDPWSFPALDGGVLYNEPLEFARRAISASGAMPAEGTAADRALLMIDPFPEDNGPVDPPNPDDPDLIASALGLLNVWKNQARFRPEDISAALSEGDFSRFLIAPARENKGKGQTDMASAGIAGFAGFMHENFRRHDYQLGRRNCQKFLRDHLAIPVTNPLVAPWIARTGGANGAVGDFYPKVFRNGVFEPDRGFMQLIPLCGSAIDPVGLLPWPRISRAALLKKLDLPLKARAKAVGTALAQKILGEAKIDPERGTVDLARPLLISGLAAWMAGLAEKSILGDLTQRDLLA
jgi:hypothetical protein